jgi:hypothetical protein
VLGVQLFDHAGTSSSKPSSFEIQQLETQMAHNNLLHAKTTAERERHMTNLTKANRVKLMRNEELRAQVLVMANAVDTQAPSLVRTGSSKSKSVEKCASSTHELCHGVSRCVSHTPVSTSLSASDVLQLVDFLALALIVFFSTERDWACVREGGSSVPGYVSSVLVSVH